MFWLYTILVIIYITSLQVSANEFYNLTLSHDGPIVLGASITFKADLYDPEGKRPSGKYIYEWREYFTDKHDFDSEETHNTTSYYTVNYPQSDYHVGPYIMEVIVCEKKFFDLICTEITSNRVRFHITAYMNGELAIVQNNVQVESNFVASNTETNMSIKLRPGDFDYVNKTATSIITYWYIDCKPYNATKDFNFYYNFTGTNYTHTIEALVVAYYDQPITTTISPTSTTTPMITTSSTTNVTSSISPKNNETSTLSTEVVSSTTNSPTTEQTQISPNISSFPYVCKSKPSIEQNKTYGYFYKEVKVRDPITSINVNGTNWIQPWDMLSLTVTCNGTGPFEQCFQIHVGSYNATDNETCHSSNEIQACKFNIEHWFLEAIDYTIVIILKNEVSKKVSQIKVNFYKVTSKPQLSVIIVPVSCSLVALVSIIFGVAYYLQSRARYTVEVADFDFAQPSAELEYKTFRERLKDSFNNAGYKHLHNNSKESQ